MHTFRMSCAAVGAFGILASSAATAGPSLALGAGAWYDGGYEQYVDSLAHDLAITYHGNKDAGGREVAPYTVVAKANGLASGGVIKAAASTGFTTGPLGSSATAYAQWSDSFSIIAPDLAAGTVVKVSYSLSLSGSTSVAFDLAAGPGPHDYYEAYAGWSLQHYVSDDPGLRLNVGVRQEVLNNGASVINGTVNGEPGSPYGQFTLTGWLPVNRPVYTYTGLNVSTALGRTAAVASGQASADLGNSVYWGGISSVTMADGSALSYTITSDSGTDYARSYVPASPVPEPSRVLMMALGLAGCVLAGRRRGRSVA